MNGYTRFAALSVQKVDQRGRDLRYTTANNPLYTHCGLNHGI